MRSLTSDTRKEKNRMQIGYNKYIMDRNIISQRNVRKNNSIDTYQIFIFFSSTAKYIIYEVYAIFYRLNILCRYLYNYTVIAKILL